MNITGDFLKLKKSVNAQFTKLANHDLFQVDVDPNLIFSTYLENFSEDIRQEYNCNCCKHFLRHYGNVVAIIDGEINTLWDFETEEPYTNVVKALHGLIKSAAIAKPFLSTFAKLGTDSNLQLVDGRTIKWNHFYFELPKEKVYKGLKTIDSVIGNEIAIRQVFKRSLDELTIDATETIIDLINQNSLYRGQEFKALLTAFLKHQKKYKDLTAEQKDTYSWLNYKEGGKIRNTAIGTLLIDLSEGRELDVAVSAFERVVAPHNYKRPTALVTKSMITQAEKTIQQLGLENSLKRRHAIAEDISVSNLLFANRDVKGQELSLFDSLKDDVVINPRTFSKVDEVPVETFINDLLPTATEVEVLFENRHSSNLVSLIAPADKTAPSLLEWDNGISWDYNGGLADSVKEKVKKAGGAIEGEVRVSLEWFNYDDLDLHVKEPNGTVIYYGRKSGTKGGILDVDKNAGSGTTREPVENIIFKNMGNLLEGVYEVRVHQFNLRERDNIGFNVEIECRGDVYNLSRSTMVGYNETVSVAKFKYSRKDGITDFVSELEQTSKTISKELWGVNTNKFHKVSMVMLSPNYWGNKPKGNKHVFFIIDKVKNPETARGIFNEMIRPDLQEHRKVFEILGSKMKVDDSEKQLSGIGFSSTVKNDVLVKLSGKFSRTIRVKF